MALTQTLGRNGSINFMEGDRKIASWSGHTTALIFFPEGQEPVKVGYYGPEYLTQGIRMVERLRTMRDVAIVRQAMEFTDFVETVERLVWDTAGVDVCWDWPSRKCFDRRLSPHEAAIECIRVCEDF